MNIWSLFRFRYLSILTFSLLGVLLSGCAVIPDNWAFEKEIIKSDALTQVKRIALLDVPSPGNIRLGSMTSSSAGAWFGLVGFFSVENTQGNVVTSGDSVSRVTRNELKVWLEQAGLEVVLVEADRTKPTKMLGDYSQFSQVEADAILEVAPIRIGFMYDISRGGQSGALSPDVLFKYRLVSVKTQEVLIESNVFYSSFDHYHRSYTIGDTLMGPKEHLFADEESVKEQPGEAKSRLHHAINGATELIAQVVTNNKQKVSFIKPNGEMDFTGTYHVEVTRELMPGYGSTNKYYCFNQKRNFTLELIQDGVYIKGYFLSGKGKISGTTFGGGVVQFVFTTSRCPNRKSGNWYVNPDGSSMHGQGWSEVKWKLQKLR